MDKINYIIEAFGSAGIEISSEKAKMLTDLSEFMVEYNKNVNLTAITDFEGIVEKHFIDSVLPFASLDIAENSRFIDVGTGAGYPSLPLLIWRGDLKGTLCDSSEKRCVYLKKACEMLGISPEIIHIRAEQLGRTRREAYDIATARAVSAMPILTEYCLPFVKVGGLFAALKSVNEDAKGSENAIKALGGQLEEIRDYTLPNGDKRRLFIVKKISQTPTKYPRNSAGIMKKPL